MRNSGARPPKPAGASRSPPPGSAPPTTGGSPRSRARCQPRAGEWTTRAVRRRCRRRNARHARSFPSRGRRSAPANRADRPARRRRRWSPRCRCVLADRIAPGDSRTIPSLRRAARSPRGAAAGRRYGAPARPVPPTKSAKASRGRTSRTRSMPLLTGPVGSPPRMWTGSVAPTSDLEDDRREALNARSTSAGHETGCGPRRSKSRSGEPWSGRGLLRGVGASRSHRLPRSGSSRFFRPGAAFSARGRPRRRSPPRRGPRSDSPRRSRARARPRIHPLFVDARRLWLVRHDHGDRGKPTWADAPDVQIGDQVVGMDDRAGHAARRGSPAGRRRRAGPQRSDGPGRRPSAR